MKRTKILLAAFALVFSTSTFANSNPSFKSEKESVSYEIRKMLQGSDFIADDSFTVKIFFEVTEENRINVQQVDSPNKEVNEFLKKRLENQKLNSLSWDANKVYMLPVRVKSRT